MGGKTGYAKYTFAFAADIQKLADEKYIKVAHFHTSEHVGKQGVYDYLTVSFIVPRPDKEALRRQAKEDEERLNALIKEIEAGRITLDNNTNTNELEEDELEKDEV